MAMSVSDVILAVKNARKCEHCNRLLYPSSAEYWTCYCSKGRLIRNADILNPQGQKAALLVAGEVMPGAFGATEQHMAWIAKLPTSKADRNGIFVGEHRVKKKAKWTRRYAVGAKEVVAIDGMSAIPTVWVFEIL